MSSGAVTRALRVSGAGEVSQEEKLRRRRLRQQARRTPEQRRRLLQYQRRHNEKDGRLVYCDYCDTFVSAREKPLERHMGSWKHMDAVEAYWQMAAHAETLWMKEIRDSVEQAWALARVRRHQRVHGVGTAMALPCMRVAHDVRVGGMAAPAAVPEQPPHTSGILPSPTMKEAA